MTYQKTASKRSFLVAAFFLVLFHIITASAFATIRYVRPGANGNGTSWANASGDLQAMINASVSGDQVWVVKGTYQPTTGTDRTISFSMKNGVAIYGGLVGNEAANYDLSQRNFTTNPTILSGDIDKNDGANFANNSGNSYHVISNPPGLTNSAILDGFTITGGNANEISIPHRFGGGMYNNGEGVGNFCNPLIRYCIFQGNTATDGGGMYNRGFQGNSSPILINCSFLGNTAALHDGGAMYNFGNRGNSSPILTNCYFQGNTAVSSNAVSDGGAIMNSGQSGTCSPILTNCSFLGNTAGNEGGAMSNEGTFGTCSPILTNCSFLGNTADDKGGVMFNNNSSPILTNCVLFGNGGNNTFFNTSGATVTATYSLFDITVTGYNTNGTGNLTTTTSPFVSTTLITLNACSPAINAGDPATTSATVGNLDLAGSPRFFNNGRVDMGAYELQTAPLPPVPVSPTTTNNALHFDGVDDHVALVNACGAGAPIVNGGDEITIEYWFKGSVLQSAVRLQPDGNNYIVSGHYGEHILSNDGGWPSGSGVPVGAAATDGNWHHIAMTWKRNTTNGFKSYLDGQLVGQRNSSNNPLPIVNSGAFLGALSGNLQLMTGTLDDVRIWSVARSQADIQAGLCSITLPQTGLVVQYTFDNGTANGDNTGVLPGVQNMAQPGYYNGRLNSFAFNGNSSNWVSTLTNNTWYRDADGDGYAETGAGAVIQCLRPSGYKLSTELTATTGDCNDANAAINPGATEICDGIDNDCDNQIDEGFTPVLSNGATISTSINTGQTIRLQQACSILGILESNGGAPVNGNITAKVLVQAVQPTYKDRPYLKRSYEIAPASNPNTATGRITLYFLQSEFDAFNAVPGHGPDLPTNPAASTSNFAIYKYSGTSSNGTGLPGTYPSPGKMLTVMNGDIQLVWNVTLQAWAATFETTGFSGFFAGNNDATILPLSDLLVFKGEAQGKDNLLSWEVLAGSKIKNFGIEKSINGTNFQAIGSVSAVTGTKGYSFIDHQPGVDKRFYRLRLTEPDGRTLISNIILIQRSGAITAASVYPNPVKNNLHINIQAQQKGMAEIRITNANGSSLMSRTLEVVPGANLMQQSLAAWAPGLYIIHVTMQQEGKTQTFKLIKE